MNAKTTGIALAILLISILTVSVVGISEDSDAETATVGGITYEIKESGGEYSASVTSESIKAMKGDVKIPASISYGGKTYAVNALKTSFSKNTAITSIELPTSLKVLPNSCFSGCSSLKSASLNGVLSIPSQCFKDCTNLASVSATSASSIGLSAFNGCSSLNSYKFGSLIDIGNYAFQNCIKITSFSIPEGCGLGVAPFAGTGIKTPIIIDRVLVYVPAGIGSYSIPSSVSGIGPGAFYGVELNSIYVPATVTGIQDYGFDHAIIKSITVDDGVAGIGSYAFSNNTVLSSLKLSPLATYLGNNICSGCTSLTSVVIPNTVTYIGDSAFYGCTSLTSVTANGAITYGEKVFQGCTSLKSFTFGEKSVPGGYMFSGCTSLTSVNFCDSIDEITNRMFYNCKGLKSFEINGNIKKIGDYAFSYSGLTEIVIPASLDPKGLSSNAFYYCESLAKVIFEGSYTYISPNCFNYCKALTEIETYGMLKAAGGNSFGNCDKLTNIIVHTSIPFEDSSIFADSPVKNLLKTDSSQGYKYVEVKTANGSSGKIIVEASSSGIQAGSDCVGFSNKALADSVGSGKSLTSANSKISYANKAVYYGTELLYVLPSSASISIKEGTETIAAKSMATLSTAADITIPSSVDKIGSYALMTAKKLKTVVICGSPTLDMYAMDIGTARAYFAPGNYDEEKCGSLPLSGYYADTSSGRVLFESNDAKHTGISIKTYGNSMAFGVSFSQGYDESKIAVTSGGKTISPASQGTKMGSYDVSGMYVISNVADGTSVSITGVKLNTYDVSFSAGTGYSLEVSQSKNVPYGSKVIFEVRCLPGYQKSSSFSVKVNGSSISPDYQTSEYSVYSFVIYRNSSISVSGITAKSSYTVTFSSNGGSSVASQTVLSGASATMPADPTKSGYTFLGWYSSSSLTELYGFGPVTKNETAYAKWAPQSAAKCKLTLSAENGTAYAYVNGSPTKLTSGSYVTAGSLVELVFDARMGYEIVSWTVNGTAYDYPSSSMFVTVSGDTAAHASSEYYATGSFINRVDTDTPTSSSYVQSWICGEGNSNVGGMVFKGMTYAPAVIGDYIFAKNDNILLKIDADDGRILKSVTTTDRFSGYYEYVTVGNGLVLDSYSGKVFDTDLNQVFALSASLIAKTFYHDGYFFVQTSAGTCCFEAADKNPSDPYNVQGPVWTKNTGSFITAYEGGTQLLFGEGFLMTAGFDGDGSVFLQTSKISDGSMIDKIYIPEFKGNYINKGYIDLNEGYATLTTYKGELMGGSAKEKIFNVASVKISDDGRFSHATLKVRSNGEYNGLSSALIVNGGYGYVFSDGTFTVYEMESMEPVASVDNTNFYGHGSMVVSTGHAGKACAYIVPYNNSSSIFVVEHNLSTNMLTVTELKEVTIKQYTGQQPHFLSDGSIVYVNDSGRMFCIRHGSPAQSLSLDRTSVSMQPGETIALDTEFTPSNSGTRTEEWTSSNKSVATVENGIVAAVSAGTATITVKCGSLSASCVVTVGGQQTHVTSISLDKTSATMDQGSSLTLNATVLPQNASDRSVIWSSADTSIATVSNGIVTAVSAGTTTITAKTNDGGYTATCVVTVKAKTQNYTITWKNWDGTTLATDTVASGVLPSYSGPTPTRASSSSVSYTFSGWNPTVTVASSNATYTAVFTTSTVGYTIKYLPGEHGTFTSQTYSAQYGNATPAFSGTPAGEAGYSFAGWSPSVSQTVTGNATYTALWTPNNYAVSYYVDGSLVSSETHRFGETVSVRAQYVKDGYEVSFWSTSDVSASNGMFVMPAKSVRFNAYAQQSSFTITWKNWNGAVLATTTVASGETPSYSGAEPTRASNSIYAYMFAGWDPEITSAAADATYTAKFSASYVMYSITYLPGEHGTFESQTYTSRYGMEIPSFEGTATGETGYAFAGWSPSVGQIVTGNAEYVALWTPMSYSVSYLVDGTIVASESHRVGETVSVRAPYVKDGYEVSAWSSSDVSVSNGMFVMPAKSVRFNAYAQQSSFTVTWKNWNGAVLATTTVAFGEMPSYPGSAPARAPNSVYSYTFAGWDPQVSAATADATYTAKYTTSYVMYSITYLPGEHGTFESQTYTVRYGVETPAFEGTAAGEEGYSFAGWSPSVGQIVTGNAAYTAQWSANSYTVTYRVDGSRIASETHQIGETVSVRAPYVKDGYNVTPWTTSDATVSSGKFVMPAKNVVFNAYTQQTSFTITWKNWDGSVLETDTVAYGSVPTYSGASPTRAATAEYSYRFAGWTPDVLVATEDATYAATFDAIKRTYSVRYLPGEHGTFQAQTYSVEYGKATPAFVGVPSCEAGYEFAGWSPSVKATVTGNIAYVAIWASKEYAVTYALDGAAVFTENHLPGETVSVRPAYQKAGYSVSDWATSDVAVSNGKFVMPAKDVSFAAISTELESAFAIGGVEYTIASGQTVEVTGYGVGLQKDVVIPATVSHNGVDYDVVGIATKAFMGSAIESLWVEEGVSIDAKAFADCKGLRKAFISSESIGGWAFLGCASLEELSLPNAKSIGASAFSGCSGLKSVSFSENLTTLGKNAFYGVSFTDASGKSLSPTASNLAGKTFSGSAGKLSEFGDGMEFKADGLIFSVISAADMTASVIGYEGSPVSISLPDAVQFNGMALSVVSVGDKAFYGCSSLISADLGSSKEIGLKAFASCSSLKSVTLSAETIGGYAFMGCSSLSGADLSAASSIGVSAFSGCSGLKSVSFSENLTTLGKNAFYGITFVGADGKAIAQTAGNLAGRTFSGSAGKLSEFGDGTEFMADGLIFSVLSAVDMTASVKGYEGSPASLSLPETVKFNGKSLRVVSVGDKAFYGCSSLVSIDLPYVSSIGMKAFANCANLASMSLSADSIGGWAFYGCPKVGYASFSESLSSIGKDALRSLSFADAKGNSIKATAENLAGQRFVGSDGKLELVSDGHSFMLDGLQYTITSEEDNLLSVTGYSGAPIAIAIPDGISYAGESYSVDSIGSSAFYGCSALKSADLGSVREIGLKAFAKCSSLKSVTLSADIIGGYAFMGCSSLSGADLSAASSIGVSAFSGCSGLNSVSFSESLNALGKNAFYGISFVGADGKAISQTAGNLAGKTFSGSGGVLAEI